MFDPDVCKQPGIHQMYCKVIDIILEIYKKGADEHRKLIKEQEENSQGIELYLSYKPTNFLAEVTKPESSTRPKKKNKSGGQSCNPDSKGKTSQCDDDDEKDGSGGSASHPSTSTSQPGSSGSNSKDSSGAASGASDGPSGATSASAADGGKYEVHDNFFNFLLEDVIAWNSKQIGAPPSLEIDKFDSLTLSRHDVPLITYHPLDASAAGGFPVAVAA